MSRRRTIRREEVERARHVRHVEQALMERIVLIQQRRRAEHTAQPICNKAEIVPARTVLRAFMPSTI